MSEELKPCPFCGKQPKIEPKNPERDGDDFTRIVCSRKEGHDAFASTTMYGENHKERAIQTWNTRTDDQYKQALIEARDSLETTKSYLKGVLPAKDKYNLLKQQITKINKVLGE